MLKMGNGVGDLDLKDNLHALDDGPVPEVPGATIFSFMEVTLSGEWLNIKKKSRSRNQIENAILTLQMNPK